jgi:hypothetical protein
MRKLRVLLIGFLLMCSGISFGQKVFSHCSAAFLNNKMVVTEYSTKGKHVIGSNAHGILTVCTAELGPTSAKAIERIVFKIAIRDKVTKTLVMFSDETFRQISIEHVLKKCAKGDHIVLMTLDNQYALPYNEMLVM